MDSIVNLYYLGLAGQFAKMTSGCTKVSVGSCIVTPKGAIVLGANRVIGNLCKTKGCLRKAKYGDNAKTHRNPDDCRALHSEIDAVANAAFQGINIDGATIYVTRYPCEACARTIARTGIKHVVFGRNQEISKQTKQIFTMAGITYQNEPLYVEEDTVV